MSIYKNLESKKAIQTEILDFINNEDEFIENHFQNLISFFNDHQIRQDPNEIQFILYLISKISTHHHHFHNFFSKIEQILLFFKDEIRTNFTNSEIFNIFQNNKAILLFLIKEELLIIDEFIVNIIMSDKYKLLKYPHYFFPEIKPFINGEYSEKNDVRLLFEDHKNDDSNNFENNRKIGQNHSYICELIRNDSVEEFVTYVNKNNLSLSKPIEQSIFESNYFLLNREDISLIEYAAFYGSIQIFQFLKLNNVQLKPSLWLFAIHGKNPELIHLLEENEIQPDDKNYEECFKEAIKCHHNDIAVYIKDNFLNNNDVDGNETFVSNCFHYYNLILLPEKINEKFLFFYFCEYGYLSLVILLLNENKVDLNERIISNCFKSSSIFDYLNVIQ